MFLCGPLCWAMGTAQGWAHKAEEGGCRLLMPTWLCSPVTLRSVDLPRDLWDIDSERLSCLLTGGSTCPLPLHPSGRTGGEQVREHPTPSTLLDNR